MEFTPIKNRKIIISELYQNIIISEIGKFGRKEINIDKKKIIIHIPYL